MDLKKKQHRRTVQLLMFILGRRIEDGVLRRKHKILKRYFLVEKIIWIDFIPVVGSFM